MESNILKFSKFDLMADMYIYKSQGNEITELQCNKTTAQIWESLCKTNYIDYDFENKTQGKIGTYKGIPIVINDSVVNGIVNIK